MGTSESSALIELFNSTSPDFDALTPQLWGRAGVALVDALDVKPGEHVLDVCAGTGASALPAAAATGPTGRVVAVDFAGDLLAVTTNKAAAAGLINLDVVVGDVTALAPGVAPCERPFDVVACSYGIFFFPEMQAATRGLMDLARPGGRLGVTVWQAHALRDFSAAFYGAVNDIAGASEHHGPRAPSGARSITRIDTVAKLTGFLTECGARTVRTAVLELRIAATPDFAWAMVMGSGMRGALAGLSADQQSSVRAELLARLAGGGITEVECDTMIAVAGV